MGNLLSHKIIGKGEKTIVFLHGWGGNSNSMIPLANAFLNEYKVVLVDFFGFGNSPYPDYPLSINDYVGAILDIVNYYKLSNIIIVGHSFGGKIGAFFTAKYAFLVDKLVLIDSSGVKPKRRIKYYINVLLAKINKRFNTAIIIKGSKDYQQLSGFQRIGFINIVNTHLTKNELKFIKKPTLMVWGEKDKDTPIYMAKYLYRHLENSRLYIIKEAGHFSYLDKKDECLLVIKNFIGGN